MSASVGPFRSASSSVTTTGTSSAAATPTSQAIRARMSADALVARIAMEAGLGVDDDQPSESERSSRPGHRRRRSCAGRYG